MQAESPRRSKEKEEEEVEKVRRGPRREGRPLSWIIQALIRATKAPWWIAAWLRCLSFVWSHTYLHTWRFIRYLAVYVCQRSLTRSWNIHIGAQTSRRPDLSRPLVTFLRSLPPSTFRLSFAPLYRYQDVFSFDLFDLQGVDWSRCPADVNQGLILQGWYLRCVEDWDEWDFFGLWFQFEYVHVRVYMFLGGSRRFRANWETRWS